MWADQHHPQDFCCLLREWYPGLPLPLCLQPVSLKHSRSHCFYFQQSSQRVPWGQVSSIIQFYVFPIFSGYFTTAGSQRASHFASQVGFRFFENKSYCFSYLVTGTPAPSRMLNHVRLFKTPQTEVHQAPLSVGFLRQEYCSGLPFPPPGESSQNLCPLCLLDLQQFLYCLSH